MTSEVASTPKSSAPEAAPPPEKKDALAPELEQLRVRISRLSVWAFGILFLLTVLAAIFLALIIGTELVTQLAIEKMALAASVQVAFGMVIGYASLWIGLMMTWFGVSAAYELSAKLPGGGAHVETTLKSASPGLFFALGGIVLVAVCLYKPIVFEQTGGFDEMRIGEGRSANASGLPTPNPPPPRENR